MRNWKRSLSGYSMLFFNMVLKDPFDCLWNITCVLVFMLVVGCYALFELHVGSANKHFPKYIFLGKGNILCNFMNACINALLDRWKSLSENSWLFLFQEIYHQFELQRFWKRSRLAWVGLWGRCTARSDQSIILFSWTGIYTNKMNKPIVLFN
jgi:hypothetical protein